MCLYITVPNSPQVFSQFSCGVTKLQTLAYAARGAPEPIFRLQRLEFSQQNQYSSAEFRN